MGMLEFLTCLNHATRAVNISMLGRSKTFAVATKFSRFYSPLQPIFTSLDAVDHGLH